MRKRIARLAFAIVLSGGFLLGMVSPARAIPGFARKYGFTCTMCHSAFPRLNDFGVRYRQNGYQLPGRENEDKTVLESPPPFAARTSGGYNYNKFKDAADCQDLSLWQINSLDLLSAGLIARNIGYFAVYPPQIGGARGVSKQPGTLEMASIVFAHVGAPWLNVRVGRFEPAYVAFSAKRQLSVSPYEIYDYTSLRGPAFTDTQEGIELTAHGRGGLSYAAGWINGSGENETNDVPQDAYLRASMVVGPGQGQVAGQRIGVTAYYGNGRPRCPTLATEPCVQQQACYLAQPLPMNSFYRIGVDASANLLHCNLALQCIVGKDTKDRLLVRSDLDFSGGFAELNYQPATNCVGFARYDLVRTPLWLRQNIDRFTAGGRCYLDDKLALHLEYSHHIQTVGRAKMKITDDFATLRFDVAF